jgi:tRNA threonylcarbamoyladenosine biosynthesis protein TsaE
MKGVKIVSHKEKGLSEIAEDIITEARALPAPPVIALYGDLGAGKTTLTKYIAKALGVTHSVTSPTFIIERIYKVEKKPFSHLVHIDAYRLENEKELSPIGWDEILKGKENIIVVEWADRIEKALPENVIRVRLTFIDDERRELSW